LNEEKKMSSTEKGRIVYFSDGESASKWERQIVPEFERIYTAENKPEGMALFSHNANGVQALSISPKSIPYCESLFAIVPWEESDNARILGAVGWVAGDEGLKPLASTYFSAT
jgi:hypothetical protein